MLSSKNSNSLICRFSLTPRRYHPKFLLTTLPSSMNENLSRRNFLSRGSAAVSAVWLSAHWPSIVAAAEHAHQAAKSSSPRKFQFFTPEEAVEIDAISARIIPSDETPGAREAGVVYFI